MSVIPMELMFVSVVRRRPDGSTTRVYRPVIGLTPEEVAEILAEESAREARSRQARRDMLQRRLEVLLKHREGLFP